MRSAIPVLLVCAVIACSEREEVAKMPPRPRGVTPDRALIEEKSTAAAPASTPRPASAVRAISLPTAPSAPAVDAGGSEKVEKKRDYAAELASALGNPSACLKARSSSDAPSEIRIHLETHVVESGAVTRSYARSSQLDEEELTCVKRSLGSVRFRAPVDEAPRSVVATLTLQLKAPDKPAETAPKPTY